MQVPADCRNGLFKCRVIYGNELSDASFSPYTPRIIRSLKLVHHNTIDYAWKYEDRSALNDLLAQKAAADEIIIVKNGYLTDSSYSNLAFYDGTTWFTPENPLLKGIQREYLLQQGKLQTAPLRVEDLESFSQIALINAMLELGDCVVDARLLF